jgi:hypothetical protein
MLKVLAFADDLTGALERNQGSAAERDCGHGHASDE